MTHTMSIRGEGKAQVSVRVGAGAEDKGAEAVQGRCSSPVAPRRRPYSLGRRCGCRVGSRNRRSRSVRRAGRARTWLGSGLGLGLGLG
eukprot:scaffold117769_cov63-Phaeocystis_antarctica.AAC.4